MMSIRFGKPRMKDKKEKTKRFHWWWPPLSLLALLVVVELVLRLLWSPPIYISPPSLPRPFYVPDPQTANPQTYITNGTPPLEIDSFEPGQAPPPPEPRDPRQLAPVRFAMPKEQDVLRVFIVGSSPIYGGPGEHITNLSTHLRRYLEFSRPARRFEIVNAAAQQLDADTVSDLLEEIHDLEPDFTLVYVGGVVPTLAPESNRDALGADPLPLRMAVFIRNLYLIQIWGPSLQRAVDRFFLTANVVITGQDGPPDEAALTKEVIKMSKRELRDAYEVMTERARHLPGHVAFYEVVSDLAGTSPLWSLHFKKLTAQEQKTFNETLEKAKRDLAEESFAAAEAAARRALAIDDTYAEAHYVLGKALAGQGRTETAYLALEKARDTDASHDRLFSEPAAELKEILEEKGLSLLPAAQEFRRVSKTGLPGKDLFRDITHPTPLGEAVLAHLGATWILRQVPPRSGEADQPLPEPDSFTIQPPKEKNEESELTFPATNSN